MKTKLASLFLELALVAWVGAGRAQTITINLGGNGVLTATNLNPGSSCSVQWAASLSGPWQTNPPLTNLNSLIVGSNGVVSLTVPMFYRVLGLAATHPATTNPIAGMALIPAGSFTMGDTLGDGYSDELPLHTVYVSAFYMDQHDVTEGLWQQVCQWALAHGYTFDNSGSVNEGYTKGPNYPVVSVNWYDCVKWCNARSEMEGRAPAYYTSDAQTTVYRTGDIDLDNGSVNWNTGYRLPTEAEWEKAGRGGLSGQRFPWGNTINESLANYDAYPFVSGGYAYDVNPYIGYNTNFETGSFYTSPVNYFAPNGYGLYDMAGNVWQWCWDWYGSYGSASQSDPRGPTSGSNRVFRGGSWYYYAVLCRTAFRLYCAPAYYYGYYGFRSVLPPGQ